MDRLLQFIEDEGLEDIAKVGTVSGRYYAMDRDNRWERVQKVYDAMVLGAGETAGTADAAIRQSYKKGHTDEFVEPDGDSPRRRAPLGTMKDKDSVIFFNFRTDRTREITRALALDDFDGFERKGRPKFSSFVCMTEYDKYLRPPGGVPAGRPRQYIRKSSIRKRSYPAPHRGDGEIRARHVFL